MVCSVGESGEHPISSGRPCRKESIKCQESRAVASNNPIYANALDPADCVELCKLSKGGKTRCPKSTR